MAADAFDKFDSNGDKRLSEGEFLDCQRELGHGMSPAQAGVVFEAWSVRLVNQAHKVMTFPMFCQWWVTEAHLSASKNLGIFESLGLPNSADAADGEFAVAWCTLKLSGLKLARKDRKKIVFRGSSDPYFNVYALTRRPNGETIYAHLKKSQVVTQDINPEWKAVTFAVDVPRTVLSMGKENRWTSLNNIDIMIDVWDDDSSNRLGGLNKDDPIGSIHTTMGHILRSEAGTKLPLVKPPNTRQDPGELVLEKCDVEYLDSRAEARTPSDD